MLKRLSIISKQKRCSICLVHLLFSEIKWLNQTMLSSWCSASLQKNCAFKKMKFFLILPYHILIGLKLQELNVFLFPTISIRDQCSFYWKDLMDFWFLVELQIYTKATKIKKVMDKWPLDFWKFGELFKNCGQKASIILFGELVSAYK